MGIHKKLYANKNRDTHYYKGTSNTKIITVTKKTPKLTIQPITATAGTQANVTIKITTQDNTPLDGKITLKQGSTTKTITAKDGTATTTVNIPLTQATKKTILTATYNGNNYYNNKTITTTFTPNKKATKITVNTIKPVTYTQTTTITGKLTDTEGKILTNTTVRINVANKTYKTNTNNKGIYDLTYKPTNTGKYTVTVAYLENQYYTSSKAKTILTVNKKNTTITIKINKKTYTTKTNNKGTYTLNYKTSTIGTNNITLTYKGNSKYKAITNKTTFKVAKT